MPPTGLTMFQEFSVTAKVPLITPFLLLDIPMITGLLKIHGALNGVKQVISNLPEVTLVVSSTLPLLSLHDIISININKSK